jgi:hypothetical protein
MPKLLVRLRMEPQPVTHVTMLGVRREFMRGVILEAPRCKSGLFPMLVNEDAVDEAVRTHREGALAALNSSGGIPVDVNHGPVPAIAAEIRNVVIEARREPACKQRLESQIAHRSIIDALPEPLVYMSIAEAHLRLPYFFGSGAA